MLHSVLTFPYDSILCSAALPASVVFMSQLVAESRKALAVYPVFLFYIVLAWVILVGSHST